MKKLSLLLASISLLLTNCHNDDEMINNPVNTTHTNVYIAGKENNTICYWKNNVKYNLQLPDPTKEYEIKKMIIENNNVYILGYSPTNDPLQKNFYFWKNGALIDLQTYLNPSLFNANYHSVKDFDVQGDDIYFSVFFAQFPGQHNTQYKLYTFKNQVASFVKNFGIAYPTDFHEDSKIRRFGNDTYTTISNVLESSLSESIEGFFKNNTFYDLKYDFQKVQEMNFLNNQLYIFGTPKSLLTTPQSMYMNTITGNKTTFTSNIPTGNFESDNGNLYVSNNKNVFKNGTYLFSAPNNQEIRDVKILNNNSYLITKETGTNKPVLLINSIPNFEVNIPNSSFEQVVVTN
ncbi:MAG: hypothetical protein QM535_11360 [Limnohabitans sp.]|nr:hypothetical protein [Limnohabitans sp.]